MGYLNPALNNPVLRITQAGAPEGQFFCLLAHHVLELVSISMSYHLSYATMSGKRSPISKPSFFFFAIESVLMEPLVNIISSPIATTFGGNYWSLFLTSCKRPLDAAWSAIICSLHVQSYFDRTDKERLLVIAWNYTCRKQWIYSPTPKSRKRKKDSGCLLTWWSVVCVRNLLLVWRF